MDAGTALMLSGAAVFVVLPTVAMIVAYLFRRLASQERLKAIEHGQLLAFDPGELALRTRRSGIVLIAAGVGIAAAVVLAAVQLGSEVLAGLGLGVLPILIGCGLIVDYRLQVLRSQRGREK